jgi:hypothetical protein
VPTNDVVLTSIFMALEGAFAYSAFLPSIMTIGTFVDTPDKVVMIRKGELVGTAFLLGLAGITAAIMKSAVPFVFGILAGGLTLVVYELALKDAPINRIDNANGATY